MPTKSDLIHTSRDVGLSLRHHFEGRAIVRFDDDGNQSTKDYGCVDFIDASDADNLIVQLDNGQCFSICIQPVDKRHGAP